jgi:predicted enzyme related to lactoylglutathione lyase
LVYKALAKVEELGGKILRPKMTLDTVGTLVTIIDSEGNLIGLWEREKKAAT